MVIGPTPPGTGVIAPATRSRAPKSTSPTSAVVGAVDADVDDDGAGLDHVGRDEARLARWRRPAMSARRVTDGRSRVREWHDRDGRVAVAAAAAPSACRRCSSGRRRPRRCPSRSVSRRGPAARSRPRGVQGTSPGGRAPAGRRSPGGSRRRPWRDRCARDARARRARRQRQLHEDAVHGRIGVELVDQRVSSACGVLAGSSW